jgi:hypothetical protein
MVVESRLASEYYAAACWPQTRPHTDDEKTVVDPIFWTGFLSGVGMENEESRCPEPERIIRPA